MNSTHQLSAISVVGLGKLGACTATALASRGLSVVGVDVNQHSVDLVNAGVAPVSEAHLQELITAHHNRLRATRDYVDAITNSEITLIIVPTPSDPLGGFSLEYVLDAAAQIGDVLATKDAYHLVVVVSTVLPGACLAEVVPIVEQHSGKKCGSAFGFCYAPEFIALGSVIRDFLNPDFVLIGEFDERSGTLLEQMYRSACVNNPPVARMNIVNAEITKISVNTFVTTKISFANMLAEICEQLPGANVDIVADAMGRDKRIGRKYLTGAVSYGGPCFPRDNKALAYLARQVGANGALAEATDEYNDNHKTWLFNRVTSLAPRDASVAVVGLTYRAGTVVLEKSAAMMLVQDLVADGRAVSVYDEHALDGARRILGDTVQFHSSLRDVIASADVVVIMTDGDDVRSLGPDDFPRRSELPTKVLDVWRVCGAVTRSPHIDYVPLGTGPNARSSQFAL